MKILHTVESYLPAQHGMSEVVRQISERLVLLGHEVTVATSTDLNRNNLLINGVTIEQFDIQGNITNGIKGEYDCYIQYILLNDFDIMTNFAAQQWASDLVFPVLDNVCMKKVFVPTGYSGLHDPAYATYFNKMPAWLKRYDRVVYLSNNYQDIQFARQHGINNDVLIPNGAAEEEFLMPSQIDIRQALGIPRDHFLILHVSGYVGGKGHHAAFKIFHKSKLNNASLLFVCPDFQNSFNPLSQDEMIPFLQKELFNLVKNREFSERTKLLWYQIKSKFKFNNKRNIFFTALSRPGLVAAYQAADLFLFPSEVECSPVVLFEAMASNTPFLSTDVGNAREIITWSNAGIILPTSKNKTEVKRVLPNLDQSANILRELSNNPEKLRFMSQAGFNAWQEKFTWQKIALQYESLYKNL